MDKPDAKLVAPREIAQLSTDDAYKKLNSSQKGLTTARAAEIRAQFGTNFLRSCPLRRSGKNLCCSSAIYSPFYS